MTNETITAVDQTATTVQAEAPAVQDVLSMVSDNIKQHKTVEKFKGKTVNDVIESYINLESHLGKKVQDLPAELVKQYLNVPTAPEKYLINEELEPKVADVLKSIGVEKNISQDQMKVISDKLIEIKRAEKEEVVKKTEEFMKANKDKLEKEFGKTLEERTGAVKHLLSKYGTEELNKEITDAGLLHNANFIILLDKISSDMSKHPLVGADFQQRTLTEVEAKAEVNKKLANIEFSAAYFNPVHPGHRQAVKEVNELLSIAN